MIAHGLALGLPFDSAAQLGFLVDDNGAWLIDDNGTYLFAEGI